MPEEKVIDKSETHNMDVLLGVGTEGNDIIFHVVYTIMEHPLGIDWIVEIKRICLRMFNDKGNGRFLNISSYISEDLVIELKKIVADNHKDE